MAKHSFEAMDLIHSSLPSSGLTMGLFSSTRPFRGLIGRVFSYTRRKTKRNTHHHVHNNSETVQASRVNKGPIALCSVSGPVRKIANKRHAEHFFFQPFIFHTKKKSYSLLRSSHPPTTSASSKRNCSVVGLL